MWKGKQQQTNSEWNSEIRLELKTLGSIEKTLIVNENNEDISMKFIM